MTIRIYPSLLPGEPIETHEYAGTLAGFFSSKGVDYAAHETQPVAVSVNGAALPVDQWALVQLSAHDDVHIALLPHGGVFKGLGSILGKVFNAVFGWLMPSSRGARDYNSPAQGRQLETSQAKANQAKLGDAVPELAGRFRRFPDYLTPPRRYFVDRRAQWLEFHACIGPGRYLIDPAEVKVGDTPFSALGEDGLYQIFEPGADLSAVSTHEHWHTVDEVGGTSSGTAGLELSTDLDNRENTQPESYVIGAVSLQRSEGEFPTGWGSGTLVFVEYPRTYSVTTITVPETETQPSYQISQITGYFGHIQSMSPGSIIMLGSVGSESSYRIRSSASIGAGAYTIRLESSTGGTPVVITPGAARSLIFGASLQREIVTMTPDAISVSVGNFESGTATDVRVIFTGGTVYGEWTSEFVACPGAELTDTLEIDFFFPGGLAYINDSGGLTWSTVEVEFEYRDIRGGPRVTARRVYTEATLDQIGFTERLSVPQMRPAVRCRRVGASSTSTQVQDTVHWYGLKSRLRTRTSYPNWTTMSVRLRSGGRLGAQSENQASCIPERILPVLQSDGTWSEPQPTRDISAFVRYAAQSIGYTDENIDMDELLRLHNLWTSRGETFDYVFDLTTVKGALNTVLRAGMAELTIADGQIRPVRDGVRTTFEQSYSPQNMTGPLRRTFRAKRHDDPDGVEVEYTNGETWTPETIICSLPGSQRLKLEKLKLDGVTDKTRAWRIGMRRAREIEYQRWEYAFGTEMDAFNSEYGSFVALFDDIPGYGQSMLLEHIESHLDGALLHVSEPLRWEEGKSHIVGYRRADGTLAGPWSATPGPDEYTLIADIPQPWPTVTLKQELPHVYFGTAERWTFPALIRQVTPNGMEAASIAAVNHDNRIYADDDNQPSE